MGKVLTKIIGLRKDEFDELVQSKQLKLRRASLIPTTKIGDEMALTSVLLSAMRLIKEFRRLILTDLKMMKGGKLYAYTEVVFPNEKDSGGKSESRIDGLIIIVQSGVIKDAALLEMKKGAELLDIQQVGRYIDIAKKFNIPNLVTVSNQQVSDPSQFPLDIKETKSLSLYHFSWTYLLTLSQILLFKNDTNIEDQDQVEIMKEVLNYFQFDKSGVLGFHQMKPGWKLTVDNINSGASINAKDKNVVEAVSSWLQEERDIALKLSRHLGVLVKSGKTKFKGNVQQRIESDSKDFVNSKILHSTYQVLGAVSDINAVAFFEKRAVELSVVLKVPKEKSLKGQIGWIKKQVMDCSKKSEKLFKELSEELLVEVYIKNVSKPMRVRFENIDQLYDSLRDKELRECRVIQHKDFGQKFSSRNKFVDLIEEMVLTFYKGIVQNLKKWSAAAPKLTVKATEEKAVEQKTVIEPTEALPLMVVSGSVEAEVTVQEKIHSDVCDENEREFVS